MQPRSNQGQIESNGAGGFGWMDYWRMFARRGIRLPLCYFLNAHLFDIRHGTDTHTWLPKDRFEEAPENFERGVLYMVSWTSEIRWAFDKVMAFIGEPGRFTFLDVGCGKGKVVLLWKRLLAERGLRQRVVGVDYYRPFIEIATSNHRRMFGCDGDFLLADATKLQYGKLGENLIVYLYNPFDADILEKVIGQIDAPQVYVIYTNPVHATTLTSMGFAVVHEKHGFHPNCQTKIFRRIDRPE